MRRLLLLASIAAAGAGGGLGGTARRQVPTMRVAAYNMEWFSEAANPERIANLRSVLANLRPDVISMEEIQSRKALDQVFGDEWTIGIADLPDEDQEEAIAVRKPFRLVSSELVFTAKSLDYAFPGGRDVLRSVVETPEGARMTFYGVHMKSRSGGRMKTDGQRQEGCGLLAAYVHGRHERRAIVLGDFNDSPEDTSLAILETGDLMAKPGDHAGGPLLRNPFEALYRADDVSFGLHDLYRGGPVSPVVPLARSENERTRDVYYRYPQDLRVTEVLMDQILVSPGLAADAVPGIYAGADALRGTSGRTRKADGRTEYAVKGSMASDHVPVYLDLPLPSAAPVDPAESLRYESGTFPGDAVINRISGRRALAPIRGSR